MDEKEMIQSQSVFAKSIVFFIVSSLVATLLILFTYFIFLFSNSKQLFQKYEKQLLLQLGESEDVMRNLTEDSAIITYLEKKDAKIQDAYRPLYEAKNRSNMDFDFYLVDQNGSIVLTNQEAILKSYPQQYFALSPLTKQVEDKTLYFKAFQSRLPNEENYLMLYQSVQNPDHLGYLVFLFREESFSFDEKMGIQFILSDVYHNKILGSDAFASKLPHYRYPIITSSPDDFFIQNIQLGDYPLKLHLLYSLSEIENSLKIMMVFTSMVSFMFFIFSKLYLRKLLEDNIYFSQLIREAILEFADNHFDYRIPIDPSMDLSSVYFLEKYNEVLDLMEATIRKNKEANALVLEAEKKLLHAQFSPHFIFNVLENIKYEIPEEAKVPQEMMMSLARIMRYSVYHQDEFIAMKDDIGYIQEYLKLQKYRYEERLEYHVHVDPACKEVYIPKLLLQPLVENSLKHGFIEDETLKIILKVQKKGKDVKITVEDNGQGLSHDKVESLNQLFQNKEKVENLDIDLGIGLLNTYRRLCIHYPKRFWMQMMSKEKEKTIVTIIVKEAGHD